MFKKKNSFCFKNYFGCCLYLVYYSYFWKHTPCKSLFWDSKFVYGYKLLACVETMPKGNRKFVLSSLIYRVFKLADSNCFLSFSFKLKICYFSINNVNNSDWKKWFSNVMKRFCIIIVLSLRKYIEENKK